MVVTRFSQPHSQDLLSHRPLGTRLLFSLQCPVCVLQGPVINVQTTTIKPEETTVNLASYIDYLFTVKTTHWVVSQCLEPEAHGKSV